MGGVSSSQQNLTSYNQVSNTININATNNFMNSAVMESMKKTLIETNQNCSQRFSATSLIRLANLKSIGNIKISNITINSQNIVKLDCLVQSQVLSQTENNFISDNSASMATMLQSVGTSDFIQSVSGTLKSKIDSMPLTFINSNSNTNSTNIIDTKTSQNIVQNITNLYKSTSVDEATMKSVNDAYQAFASDAQIQVTDVSSGNNIEISAIRIDNINSFDASARLAAAITNVVIQKMQSILGMKIEFQSETDQQSNTNSTAMSNNENTSTADSVTRIANNAVTGLVSTLTMPLKIVAIVAGVIIGIIILLFIYKLITSSSVNNSAVTEINTSTRKLGDAMDAFLKSTTPIYSPPV